MHTLLWVYYSSSFSPLNITTCDDYSGVVLMNTS